MSSQLNKNSHLLLVLYIYIYIYKIAVTQNGTPVLTDTRNILYRWPNRYSLQYGIDFFGYNSTQYFFIRYEF